jgi:glycosyltransferase involved in cell wall biosynthesis
VPIVSVVIPTYNRAKLIRETLDSVLAQSIHDIEVIVVDDGSTDDTASLIDGYGQNVRYLRQENAGQGAARNRGIHAANSDYIAFLDDDDLWMANKLEKQMPLLLNDTSIGWVYCDAEVFNGKTGLRLSKYSQINHPYSGSVAKPLILRDFIASPTPIVRRAIFNKVGYFEETALRKNGRCYAEDWDMWLRIAAGYPLAYIPMALARYRIHENTTLNSESIRMVYQSRVDVIKRSCDFAPAVYESWKNHATAAVCLFTGRQFALVGNTKDARAMFAQAIHLLPGINSAYAQWLITLPGSLFLRLTARLLLWIRDRQYST